MKLLYLSFLLLMSMNANAQLVFKNSNPNANNISKFMVSQTKTEIFAIVNNKEILFGSWDKVPTNSSSEEGQNQYKIIVTKEDKVAKRIYEIQYSLYRKTNKYVGYIRSTFVYFDKRPTKIIEDYFTI